MDTSRRGIVLSVQRKLSLTLPGDRYCTVTCASAHFLVSSKQSQISFGASLGNGGDFVNCLCDMAKMAAMSITGTNLEI